MRVNQHWAQRARDLVSEVFPIEVLRDLAEHPFMPEDVRAAIARIDNDPEGDGEYELQAVHAALAGAAAVPLMSADHGRQSGIATSFMSEVNMIRSGFVSADLGNSDAYEHLFPEVAERYGPEDGAIVTGGLRSHVAGMFSAADTSDATMRAVVHLVIERSAAFEGQAAGRELAVANYGEITAEHVLNAADALAHVTGSAGIPFMRGTGMILNGMCEFVGGQAAMQQYVAEVYPASTGAERASVCDRVQAYMRQFNGELVNSLIREIGAEWLATEAANYLAAHHQEALDYDGDDDEPDYEMQEDDDGPLNLEHDTFDFRM